MHLLRADGFERDCRGKVCQDSDQPVLASVPLQTSLSDLEQYVNDTDGATFPFVILVLRSHRTMGA